MINNSCIIAFYLRLRLLSPTIGSEKVNLEIPIRFLIRMDLLFFTTQQQYLRGGYIMRIILKFSTVHDEVTDLSFNQFLCLTY